MARDPQRRIDIGPHHPVSIWPNRSQLCLLRAALWSGADACAAWAEWQQITNVSAIDYSSWCLLPLVWRNLSTQGVVNDPLLEECRGYYRYHWARNQLKLRQTAAWVSAWQAEGIPVVVLKGIPLVVECYRDAGLRPMSDVDLLVPLDKVHAAAAWLRREGWVKHIHVVEWPDVTLEAQQSYNWQKGDARLDLHWHVDERCTEPGVTDWQWSLIQPLTVNGVSAGQLCPELLLVHVCSHGMVWNSVQAPFRWLADVDYILRRHGPDFDWRLVLEAAARADVRLVLRHGLAYAATELRLPVPPEVLAELDRLHYTWAERFAYRCTTDPSQGGRLGRGLQLMRLFGRLAREGTVVERWRRVSRAMCTRWGARTLPEALWCAARKIITGDKDTWLERDGGKPAS